jgi:hypothetical protein|tara:strand:+ start:389 stop:745 length:357 start_codon:yes stop_codon:yes gene_type:complete
MASLEYSTTTKSITIAATATGDDATVVYTCPANHAATVELLHIANNNDSSKKVYVQLYQVDDTAYHYILKNYALAANSAKNVLNNLHLQAGDKIVMYGQTTNTIESIVSVRQFFNPLR